MPDDACSDAYLARHMFSVARWQALTAFSLAPGLAAAHVLALDQLSKAEDHRRAHSPWSALVLSKCEEQLGRFVDAYSQGRQASEQGTVSADWRSTTAIFTAGEVCSCAPFPSSLHWHVCDDC